jgi:hypothetical protein
LSCLFLNVYRYYLFFLILAVPPRRDPNTSLTQNVSENNININNNNNSCKVVCNGASKKPLVKTQLDKHLSKSSTCLHRYNNRGSDDESFDGDDDASDDSNGNNANGSSSSSSDNTKNRYKPNNTLVTNSYRRHTNSCLNLTHTDDDEMFGTHAVDKSRASLCFTDNSSYINCAFAQIGVYFVNMYIYMYKI